MRKAVNHLRKCDPVLGAIIERVGPCRMQFAPADFCRLAEAIIYQQLNGKAAATIFKRFAELAGDPLTPEGILILTDEQLRSVGLSKQKSSYVKDLAAKTAAGLLDFKRLSDLPDEEVIQHLTQVKGIGVWTSHMFLIFSLSVQTSCPPGITAYKSRSRSTTKNASCRSRRIWKKSLEPGSLTEALPVGTCGGVWTSKRCDSNPFQQGYCEPRSPVWLNGCDA